MSSPAAVARPEGIADWQTYIDASINCIDSVDEFILARVDSPMWHF